MPARRQRILKQCLLLVWSLSSTKNNIHLIGVVLGSFVVFDQALVLADVLFGRRSSNIDNFVISV